MIAKNNRRKLDSPGKKTYWSWISLILTAVFLAVGIWYIAQRVTFEELSAAFLAADPIFILFSVSSVILTLVIKSLRWQILLMTPEDKPAFSAVFWSFNLGAYINLIVPFMRMGEIARLFAVDGMANVGKTRALSTIVVEKLLDLIMLGLMLILILPFVILPKFVNNPVPMVTAVSLASCFILYLLAFQTKWIIKISRIFAGLLPDKWEQRVMQLLVSGLEGLDALRNKRQTLIIIGLSVLIAFLSVMNGYLLFPAFHLDLSILNAIVLTIIITLAIVPPSTPGKIGVLNGATALVLIAFGIEDDAIIISFSTVYYTIIIMPVILFGGLAVSRTKWKWGKHRNT